MKPLRELRNQLFDRVNPLIGFSVSRYVFSVGIFIAVVIFGVISARSLGVNLLPSVDIPIVAVFTSYPGATPSAVDQQVTQTIENAVSNVAGVTSISSSSSSGSSRVIVQFDTSTNRDSAANQVAAQISAATRGLPSGVSSPSVRTFDPNSQPILEFGISGGSASLTDVYDYTNNVLAPTLQRVAGVANVGLSGYPTRQFSVYLNPSLLRAYNITPQQVTQAISSSAVSQPIGTITRNGSRLSFATQNIPTSVDQVSQIRVDTNKGITVNDLGTVQDTSTASSYTRVNGKPVILVSIQQASGSNAVAVANGVRQLIAHTSLPQGYSVTYSNDTTGPIVASIDSTYRELLITALVVAFVVLLFLGRLNTVFNVVLAIPIALSAAPALYSLLGFTFNLVSLLALIVAIGIVVDDSIVVAENVERYRALGFGRKEAVLRGASEVFSAVAAASLSILAVLIPVSFMGGFIGRYLQQFSLGLAAAVFFSWFEALLFLTVRMSFIADSRELTWHDAGASIGHIGEAFRWGFRAWRKAWGIVAALIIAALMWRFLSPPFLLLLFAYPLALSIIFYLGRALLTFFEALTTTLHGFTEAGLEVVRNGYTRLIGHLLGYSAWILGGAALFFVATILFVFPHLSFNFVPESDSGSLNARLNLGSGTSLYTTNEVAAKIEAYLLSQPDVQTVQMSVSAGNAGFTVRLIPKQDRPNINVLTAQYQQALRQLVQNQPSARVFISGGGGFRGQGTSVNFNLASTSYDLLAQRANQALNVLQNSPYVLSANSNLSQTSLENDFVPDPARLSGTGITPSQVAQALQTYTTGTQAGNVQLSGLQYPIQVQVNPSDLADAQSLLSLPMYSSTLQSNLTVGQLGSIVQNQAPINISRTNRLYTAQLSINPTANAPTTLVLQNQITQQLTQAGVLDSQVVLEDSGAFSRAALSRQLGSLGLEVFGLSLLLVYLVMGAQFNSFRYPFYLLLPVPLAIVGAMWFIYLFNGNIDIFSVLGFLLLIGLSAKNAILYLDFVVERLGAMPFKDALVEAANLRFRPIVMTTLTVLVISFPLILGRGEGSEYGRGLGVVMLGGIFLSAVLTFFVVPAAFYLFERRRYESQPIEIPQKQEVIPQ